MANVDANVMRVTNEHMILWRTSLLRNPMTSLLRNPSVPHYWQWTQRLLTNKSGWQPPSRVLWYISTSSHIHIQPSLTDTLVVSLITAYHILPCVSPISYTHLTLLTKWMDHFSRMARYMKHTPSQTLRMTCHHPYRRDGRKHRTPPTSNF